MHDIDFLPAEYRQQHALRRRQPWRIILVGVVAALVGLASVAQHYRRRSLEAELAAIQPQHDLAVGQNQQLAALQSQLLAARATAELFTYLRHPWPRTRILAEVLAPLPAEVTLNRLDIARQTPTGRGPAQRRSRAEEQAEQAAKAALQPATRDLKRLREEADPAHTIVTVAGVTTDGAALHRYLGSLEKSDLFSKVELSDIETSEGDPTRSLKFSTVLIVRPGYGQPGGPKGSGEKLAAQTRGPHEDPN